jgi:DNA mismatch repair protein MLH1
MSQPGAFAAAIARCTCTENPSDDTLVLRLPRQAVLRPKKVLPTACNFSSVNNLRKRIQKRADSDLLKQLRSACFVGVVSRHRSLLQCGEDLVLLNHYDCSREMFYQLALTQFGGGSALAKLGEGGCGGVDIRAVIAQAVQLEDAIQQCESEEEVSQLSGLLPVSETNTMLAGQAATCLMDKAEMLEEYFSVAIEQNDEGMIMLTGLPVLLEGYTPQKHALPLFLLRLATEVDWSEEKPCFHGVCRELAAFYAELPSDADIGPHVQHQVFPAITTLLIPHERLKEDGGFSTLTKLSKLYRVFERC